MQLTRAKPGNPASTHIFDTLLMRVSGIALQPLKPHKQIVTIYRKDSMAVDIYVRTCH